MCHDRHDWRDRACEDCVFRIVCPGHRGCRGRGRRDLRAGEDRDGAVTCPGCGVGTARVHEYRELTAADVPVDGRRVLVRVRVRCPQPPSSAGRVRGCRPATCQGPRSCRACGARPCPHAVEDGSRPAQAAPSRGPALLSSARRKQTVGVGHRPVGRVGPGEPSAPGNAAMPGVQPPSHHECLQLLGPDGSVSVRPPGEATSLAAIRADRVRAAEASKCGTRGPPTWPRHRSP